MTHPTLDEWLREQAATRTARGLHRELRPRAADDRVLDLAGNDYLGLARHPDVVEAAVAAARTWGCGATASRLVTGTTQLHTELEDAIADFAESGCALVLGSGYAANLAVVVALTDADTLIVSDELNHASLIDGCRLSRGRTVVTPHRDVEAVAAQLSARGEPRALVVTDAVFSVDGDLAPLAELHDVCVRHSATLLVDEAHAFGVVGPGGRGAAAAAGLSRSPHLIRSATLSKSLGAQGGVVLASPAVVAHLVDTARAFIFDTGLAPPAVGAALRALQLLVATPELADRASDAARALAAALGRPAPDACIVSVPVPDPTLAVAAARRCAANGVRVGCFRPPSVPAGGSRLRATARADLTAEDVAFAGEVIRASLAEVA